MSAREQIVFPFLPFAMKFLSKIAAILACLGTFGANPPGALAVTANVSVINFAFTPAVTNISPGDTVLWTWPSGSFNHNVHSTSTPQAWTSSALLSGPATFSVTFTNSGTYPYNCTLHGFTGSIVVVTNNNNSPPTISITNPAGGTVFAAPASVTIRASATDSDGSVTNVQFLVGTGIVGNVPTAPFFSVTNLSNAGSYTLTAIVSDDLGAKNTNSVSISVVNPVAVTLTNAAGVFSTNFQFRYAADIGLNYVIQRSTNVAGSWISIVTNIAASNPVVFVDTHATNNGAFYRVGRMPNP